MNTILLDNFTIGVEHMSIGLFFIIGTCFIQVLAIITYISYYRKWVSQMNGMMISMSVAMMVGILMGTILGVFNQGDLFGSTIYSVLLSLLVGFIAGLPVGLPAVIDGMISGLMGGMMGAMLGDMLGMARPDTTIKIMALIVTMILLLVLYTAEDQIRKKSGQTVYSFFKYPFALLFIIAVLFIGLTKLEIR
ncbi:hypothetical protein [Virgibacillus sp. L01]|uniref:hypothetical protein n=1 Tax=Virgibacillus sp. L01 TaxID=3457429 RepID=UPI003FD0D0C2